jgi:hypothetical protein
VDKFKNMSEDEEIGVDIYGDADDEKSSPLEESIEEGFDAQPVEIVREEIVTVAENPSAATFSEEKVSMIGNTEDDGDGDLYKLVKAHSIQLSRLTDIVESLQSQIKQLGQTLAGGNKTSSVRRRRKNTMKTKKNKAIAKKTKRRSSKKK